MFSQAEEDVYARSNWSGLCQLQSEEKDGLTSDRILLVVQGEDDLGGDLGLLDWVVCG